MGGRGEGQGPIGEKEELLKKKSTSPRKLDSSRLIGKTKREKGHTSANKKKAVEI